jgi:hypothetical protein
MKIVRIVILIQLSCLLVLIMCRRRRLVKSRRNNLNRSGGKRKDACKAKQKFFVKKLD